MDQLPNELVEAICGFTHGQTLKSLMHVNKNISECALPSLYRNVDIYDWHGGNTAASGWDEQHNVFNMTPKYSLELLSLEVLHSPRVAHKVRSLRVFRSGAHHNSEHINDLSLFHQPQNFRLAEAAISKWAMDEEDHDEWFGSLLSKDHRFDDAVLALLLTNLTELRSLTLSLPFFTVQSEEQHRFTCLKEATWTIEIFLEALLSQDSNTPLHKLRELCITGANSDPAILPSSYPHPSARQESDIYATADPAVNTSSSPKRYNNNDIDMYDDPPPDMHADPYPDMYAGPSPTFSATAFPSILPTTQSDDYANISRAFSMAKHVPLLENLVVHKAVLADYHTVAKLPVTLPPQNLVRLELSGCRFRHNFRDLREVLRRAGPIKTLVLSLPREWECGRMGNPVLGEARAVPRDYLFDAIHVLAGSLENLEVHLARKQWEMKSAWEDGFEGVGAFSKVRNLVVDAGALLLDGEFDWDSGREEMEDLFPNVEIFRVKGCRDTMELRGRVAAMMRLRTFRRLETLVLDFMPGSMLATVPYRWTMVDGERRMVEYVGTAGEGAAMDVSRENVERSTGKGKPRYSAEGYMCLARECGIYLVLLESSWEGGVEPVVPGMMGKKADGERKMGVWQVSAGMEERWRYLDVMDL
ncbi:Hypothetical protein D9617_20g027480 [Elsinoe fawcettii]|nr:Hypothetical protein D9617_20g027480 [Elsinoe fawcettii]